MRDTDSFHGIHPTRRQTLLAMLGTALLPACGGGAEVAGLSSGGTGSFTTGVIVGLGSVIVNGIRYDDSNAIVTSETGTSTAAALQLGMVVRIQGSAVTPAAVPGGLAAATASSIDYSSEWRGPVANVEASARRFSLLGQTVRLLPNTVFAGAPFDGTLDGRYVEAYGFLNPADGSLQATRIEVEATQPDHFRLSGVVTDLTATTFKLGSAVINRASANSSSANLQNGLLVRVKLQTLSNANGQWVATEIRAEDFGERLDDNDEAEIEGSITVFTSSTRFSVNGIAIDASRITPPAGLALGVRVEVKGSVSGGTVIATEVEIEDENDTSSREYELHGAVSALDLLAKSFVIRGYSVRYSDAPAPDATSFELGGKPWTNGLTVEVKARLDATGELVASKIKAHD
jgi:hypothetical protein